jgi:hypothetical protein
VRKVSGKILLTSIILLNSACAGVPVTSDELIDGYLIKDTYTTYGHRFSIESSCSPQETRNLLWETLTTRSSVEYPSDDDFALHTGLYELPEFNGRFADSYYRGSIFMSLAKNVEAQNEENSNEPRIWEGWFILTRKPEIDGEEDFFVRDEKSAVRQQVVNQFVNEIINKLQRKCANG